LIAYEDIEIILETVEYGALNATPLMEAIAGPYWAAACLLLDAGATPTALILSMLHTPPIRRWSAGPALARSWLRHNPDVENVLALRVNIATSQHHEADNNLFVILKHDAVEERKRHPSTKAVVHSRRLLHLTAEHGLAQSLNHLISRGVSIQAEDEEGRTAILLAIGSGHQYIAMMLHRRGAELTNLERCGGETLFCAAFNNNIDGVKLLVQRGVSVNASHNWAGTPLIAASQAGHYDMVKFLIQRGAKVSLEIAATGQTALHYAAKLGRARVAELLIQSGAEVNLTDGLDRTALHLAAGAGETEMVKLLLSNKADGKLWTKAKKSAWDYLKEWRKETERERENDENPLFMHI
jgi:ankyrin repeat protein